LTSYTMRSLILLAVVGVAVATDEIFLGFSQHFNKEYRNPGELMKRRAIFNENHKKMVEHNKRYAAGEVSWSMGMTDEMDLTEAEWLAKRTGGLPYYDNTTVFLDTLNEEVLFKMSQVKKTPREFNWVDQGGVSSVKNQAQCGSCAAFAAVGAIESCTKITVGNMADDLSEQHLLDCAYNHVFTDGSGSWGCYGCDGAWPQGYIDWITDENSYNQEESAYPYTSGRTGDVTSCRPSSSGYNKNFRVTGMHNQWFTNEMDMETMLLQNPVVTAVQANSDWSYYNGGVLDSRQCCNAASDSSCIYNLNHAVLVVGYGRQSGQDYWLIKNSWGRSWGENGFVKVKKGTGHCGVGSLHQTVPTCR